MGVASVAQRIEVTGAQGIRLTAWEFGDSHKAGQDPPRRRPGVLLLHGLMGRASTWGSTARWLLPRFRVIGLDQRGHGSSDKPDGPYTRAAYIADAAAAIEQLDLAPAVIIGHAMGALNAWQLAARRPELVSAIVSCDMRASAVGEASLREHAQWFDSWPLPFESLAAARRFFAEDDPSLARPRSARGDFFLELLCERDDGYWPIFSFDHMLGSLENLMYDAYWDELALVSCPTLVVRGLDGALGRAEAQEMVRVLPRGHYAEVPDAGHIVHYDQPETWRSVVELFLSTIGPTSD